MIEVTHHGNTSERQMCPNCNCVFIYSKVDIEWRNLITESRGYISCPECGQELLVKVNK
jgi:DNA-directed RNA polymerase subunit RPC12/RpoP